MAPASGHLGDWHPPAGRPVPGVPSRRAVARGRVTMLATTTALVGPANELKKGDVLGTARFAGCQAAKSRRVAAAAPRLRRDRVDDAAIRGRGHVHRGGGQRRARGRVVRRRGSAHRDDRRLGAHRSSTCASPRTERCASTTSPWSSRRPADRASRRGACRPSRGRRRPATSRQPAGSARATPVIPPDVDEVSVAIARLAPERFTCTSLLRARSAPARFALDRTALEGSRRRAAPGSGPCATG